MADFRSRRTGRWARPPARPSVYGIVVATCPMNAYRRIAVWRISGCRDRWICSVRCLAYYVEAELECLAEVFGVRADQIQRLDRP